MDELSEEVIEELKSLHGEIFLAEIEGMDIVFRCLTINEFNSIIDKQESGKWTSADAEEYIGKVAIIWPRDVVVADLFRKSGSISALAQEVFEESGFTDPLKARELLFEARNNLAGTTGSMMAAVLLAMPHMSLKELKSMTFRELAELTALAEDVIYLTQAINGLHVEEQFRIQIRTMEEIEAEMSARIDKGTATKGDPVAQKLAKALRESG